jgi:nicotinamidase-related amidase
MWIFCYFVNLAAASPWLRRSWSPNYSVLVYVEAAAINDPEISVVYTKHWSSEDHNDKNGKQAKLKEFPDENEMTKYRQDLRRTENFNQGNQEEVNNLT